MTHGNHRFDPKKCDALLSTERWTRWTPLALLAQAGMEAGESVLDIGCGPGFWTIPIAEIVGPPGQVIALDVSRELLDALVSRNPPPCVRPVLGELPAIDLPDASVDFIWAAFVFHEVEQPSVPTSEMHRVLRPNGRLAVLDWRPDASSDNGPPRQDRLSSEEVIAHLDGAGFRRIPNMWKDDDAYLVTACQAGCRRKELP